MIRFNNSVGFRLGVVLLTFSMLTASKVGAQILSSKRGFADTGTSYNNLQATGAGWYYTWGTSAASPGSFDANHIPMFWNAPSQNTINGVKSRNTEWVLGFNEPERSDQANMPVTQAISSWSTISNSFAGTTTKLISPGVADTVDSGTTIGGRTWLSNFMTERNARKTVPLNPNYNPNLRVDAVAFHWYGASSVSCLLQTSPQPGENQVRTQLKEGIFMPRAKKHSAEEIIPKLRAAELEIALDDTIEILRR